MSTADIVIPTITLPTEDDEPLESNWHRTEINLLIDSLYSHWPQRSDFFAGGNMFIYYSIEQARHRAYRGPDFFVVLDMDGSYDRGAWVVWEERGRYPNLIIELLSPSTAHSDRTSKKTLYEQTFRTPVYLYYDPEEDELAGFELQRQRYVALVPNEEGRLWCSELGM